jgi:hypothetical protein
VEHGDGAQRAPDQHSHHPRAVTNTPPFGQLKKETRLPDDLLSMGIGWLAREDKIHFSGTPEVTAVSLQ